MLNSLKDRWYFDYHNKVYNSLVQGSTLEGKFPFTRVTLQAFIFAIYSVSIVNKATYFCDLDCHDTAPMEKLSSIII